MMTNAKFFRGDLIPQIRQKLFQLNDEDWVKIQSISFKDPNTSLLISIFAGAYGIDRFYIGNVGLGVAKLLTCGGIGIWAIVDWFLISDATRDKNAELLLASLY